MKTLKAVLCAVMLTAVADASGWTQNQAHGKHQRYSVVDSTPAQRHHDEMHLQWLQKRLDEYHQGKRDARDGYLIMFQMLQDYGSLGLSTSTACQQVLQEWHALRDSHPEFKINRPEFQGTLLSDQQAMVNREKKKAKIVAAKIKTWVPKDTAIVGVYGFGNKAMVAYQYRIGFLKLPKQFVIAKVSGMYAVQNAVDNKTLQPYKWMTFQHAIETWANFYPPLDAPIWVCSSPILPYGPGTKEEKNMFDKMSWINKKGTYADFCGAVSLAGKIIYKLPIQQHSPDQLIKVLEILRGGKTGCFAVGEKTLADNDVYIVGKYKKILIWDYPDKLHIFNISQKIQIEKALQKRGLDWALADIKRL